MSCHLRETGLRFPKAPKKKKRRKHAKSLIQEKDGTCFLCALLNNDYSCKTNLEEHHIFGGANRKLSEEYGLKVYLCQEHHREGPEAVHKNAKTRDTIQQIGQQAFENAGHRREEFMKIFGRNWL